MIFLGAVVCLLGTKQQIPNCVLSFLIIITIYSAIEVWAAHRSTIKSCEIWLTGRGSCQEAMAQILHRLVKGGTIVSSWKFQIWIGVSHVLFHLELWNFVQMYISSLKTSFQWWPISTTHNNIFCKLHFSETNKQTNKKTSLAFCWSFSATHSCFNHSLSG